MAGGGPVYVDSGGFIALVWRRDKDHLRVARRFRALRRQERALLTTEAVISETATRLRYDAGLAAALAFHRLVAEAESQGALVVHAGDRRNRRAAFAVMEQYGDLRLSLADCLGAVVAARAGATVLGLDNDFRVMGFTLEP